MSSMNRAVLRFAYRLLLGLHPASFRDEFGAEMLWIFDEESVRGKLSALFVDGAISLLRQRCGRRDNPYQLSITSGAIITGPGIGPVRFLQGGITFLVILFSLLQIFGRPNRWSTTIRWSDRMSCYTLTLQAPSHAEVVLETNR